MQTQNSFFDELKQQYKHGGMTIRLLFINIAVFLIIGLFEVLNRILFANSGFVFDLIGDIFFLHTQWLDFLTHPWGLITSIFAHQNFMHFLWNMLFLYMVGRIFAQFFDEKRLLYTYLVGGMVGGLFEVLIQLIILGMDGSLVIGASGAIMAVLVAAAFHNHRYEILLFGVIRVRLIYIAIAFILMDLYRMGTGDGTAHFAHLGGAAVGMLSVQKPYSSSNIILRAERIGDRIQHFFKVLFNPTRTPKIKKSKTQSRTQQFKSDEDYNIEAKERQKKIDKILDKISKSGYESLTKEEKAFLFQQSKNG